MKPLIRAAPASIARSMDASSRHLTAISRNGSGLPIEAGVGPAVAFFREKIELRSLRLHEYTEWLWNDLVPALLSLHHRLTLHQASVAERPIGLPPAA